MAPVERLWIALPPVYMGGLYFLSSIPGEPTQEGPAVYHVFVWVSPALQNLLHVPVYGVLAWLWIRSLRAWIRWPVARVLMGLFMTLGYGVLDEWHQLAVPGRYASLTDALLNGLGAAAGAWLATRRKGWA